MLELKALKNAEPLEQELQRMIVPGQLNILTDESCTEEVLLTVLQAAGMYIRTRDHNISVRIIAGNTGTRLLKIAAEYCGLAECFSVIAVDAAAELLTAFLGCDVYVTVDRNSDGTTFAEELHEVRILPRTCREEKLENGAYHVECTPESLCAVFMQIVDENYPAELFGHSWLA